MWKLPLYLNGGGFPLAWQTLDQNLWASLRMVVPATIISSLLGALNGYLPERFPNVTYMRDVPVPPAYAQILAEDSDGCPAVFQIGDNVFGFTGHPGFKAGMAEDLIMEFEEAPRDTGPALQQLREMKTEIEDALVPIMTGIVQLTGLMQAEKRIL